jgi:hypothetical protein
VSCSSASRVTALLGVLAAAAFAAGAGRGAPAQGPVVVARGLDSPVDLAAPAGEPGRLYVVEQKGTIRVIANGRLQARPFLDIESLVSSGGERGLLSVAFHPRYAQNHLFYVDYTDTDGNTRVVEYRSAGGRAVPSSARQLLFVEQPFSNHNGGQLAFGPDGDLYIGDVGQDRWEEIDYVPRAKLAQLINFGWAVYEGRSRYDPDRTLDTSAPYRGPVQVYSHALGCSVTGGFVYRGKGRPGLAGRYFFGDYCSGTVWSMKVVKGRAVGLRKEAFTIPALTSFGEDARGGLYAVSQRGAIYRIAG